jgi:hypothetical protein
MRVLERLDFTVALPQLYVVTVNQLPGVFFRGFIIGTNKLYCPEKMAVDANHVNPITGHCLCSAAGSRPSAN